MQFNKYCLVCGGDQCGKGKGRAEEIYRRMIRECEDQQIKDHVQVVQTGCFGLCQEGPVVKVLPAETFYVGVKPEDVEEIVL